MRFRRVLLTNHYLCNYAGSELLTLEKAKYFVSLGAEVYVAFFLIGEKFKSEFDELGVKLLDLRASSLPKLELDLFWGHHFTTFDSVLVRHGLTPKYVVFSSLSPFESLEVPPIYFENFSYITANSVETVNSLASVGVLEEKIYLFENAVVDEFFDFGSVKKSHSLNKIAVISNHVPLEVVDAVTILRESFEVDIFGLQYTSVHVGPELLAQYDLVISIGRTVQQCFAMRIPIYCYDRFGGPGYLSKENYREASNFNYSGRCASRVISANELAEELISGYENSVSNLEFFYELAESRYRFSSLVDILLRSLTRNTFRELSPSLKKLLCRQLGFYGQALGHGVGGDEEGSKEIASVNIKSWLAERRITPQQEVFFTEVVNNTLPAFSIAVVIYRLGVKVEHEKKQKFLVFEKKFPGLSFLFVSCSTYEEVVSEFNKIVYNCSFTWCLFIEDNNDINESGLLMAYIELLNENNICAVSFDGIYREDSGYSAALRPSNNLDYLLSFPAGVSHHWLFHRQSLKEIGGFNPDLPGAFELDSILRLINSKGLGSLGHIPEPLVITELPALVNVEHERIAIESHLRERGYENAELQAPMPGRYRVWYGHTDRPIVSIMIPTKNQLPMIQRCVESILEKTSYKNYEILIIDNNSDEPEAVQWLDGIAEIGGAKVRVLRYPKPFNFSAMNNFAAQQAVGDYLLLLNNDTAVIDEHWLDAMLNHGQRPEVGAVGAKLLFPNGTIQHAGVILGLNGPAEHPFIGEPMDAAGYMQRLQVDQNYSAVTAACLLVRKEIYFAVGGMDEESFKVSYNDVDLCLKIREQGYLNVWTPHAVLLHEGSVSQKNEDTSEARAKRKRFVAEQDSMYDKWLPELARDPAYNPNFSLAMPGGFKLADSQISWRPLDSIRPEPVALVHPADLFGCGHYRVMQPFLAMKEAGLLDGAISTGLMHVTDLERYNPDTIVLQRQIGDERLEAMRRMQRFSSAFKVYELDDYLPNLPLKSVHRASMPKDILRSLRRGLSFVDRFVVSTHALAEAFAGLHGEIVVRENRLPLSWWSGLQAQRRQGKKPRVGWAGGSSHTGDLELIVDVVRDLADEVEWVFFGMCPEGLKPYVHEFHEGVAIEDYPARLASMNLDLGLAPLEHNLFNECKSNLRQLEYGACGIPTICTDIRPYQEGQQAGLPVTLVRNRYKDWVDAIRMHISDLDATARLGDELQAKVLAEWMLEGEHLKRWSDAWLRG